MCLSTKATNVPTEGKLWLYLGASWTFVLLSKLHTGTIKDQMWIMRSSRWQESNLLKVPSDKPPWWTKELLKHTNFLPMCKFPPLQMTSPKAAPKGNNLESKKETHDKALNPRALRRLKRAFPPNCKRTWDKRHLKKIKSHIIAWKNKEIETRRKHVFSTSRFGFATTMLHKDNRKIVLMNGRQKGNNDSFCRKRAYCKEEGSAYRYQTAKYKTKRRISHPLQRRRNLFIKKKRLIIRAPETI